MVEDELRFWGLMSVCWTQLFLIVFSEIFHYGTFPLCERLRRKPQALVYTRDTTLYKSTPFLNKYCKQMV